MLGNLNNFVTEDMLNNYEILSFASDRSLMYFRGQLTLFKNNEDNKFLFNKCPTCIEAILKVITEIGREEKDYSMDVIQYTNTSIYFVMTCMDDHEMESMTQTFIWKNGNLYHLLDQNFYDSILEKISHPKPDFNRERCKRETKEINHEESCFYMGEGQKDFYRETGNSNIISKHSNLKKEIGFYHFSYSRKIRNQHFQVDPFSETVYLRYNFEQRYFIAVDSLLGRNQEHFNYPLKKSA